MPKSGSGSNQNKMKKPRHDEDAPLFESIRTHKDIRRESIKVITSRLKKGRCYKMANSRKQALSLMNEVLARRHAPYLRIYKCPNCGYWHLTHKVPTGKK